MTKTALITGSAGFLGSYLCPRLTALGYELARVDPHEEKPHFRGTFQQWLQCFGLRMTPAFDVVVHLASNLTQTNIEQRNKLGNIAFLDITTDYRMAEYLERHSPRQRAVWLSSCAVDAQESENYAFVKYVGERFASQLAKRGVPITILRPYGGYGPGQSLDYPFPSILARAMREEDPLVVWGSLETARDWIYVEDLVDTIVEAAEGKFASRLDPEVLVGTGRCTTFGELARMMAKAVGYYPQIIAQSDKPIGSKHRVCPVMRPVKVPLEEGIRKCLEAMRAAQLQQG